ncbi:putative exported protein [Vibrio ishigakensis]|uniref:Putative exported protein n=1 Tax=Vibrio ishigakensis TaxID=1481914 RepID=A0A0B8P0I4_9VIBR|nr:CueP family metal-binding protein [Vibrio ishigakensis]GAM56838.1 putative exported protein [Vibrio ishigakensis]
MKAINKLVAGVMLLASFSALASQGSEFEKLTPEQALVQANQWYGSNQASVQIFPTYITANFADGSHANIPITDKHPISIAPYINHSHPCDFHVATGCTRELKGVKVGVTVYDESNHKQLMQKMMTTNPNGFVDLWLPKDKKNLTVVIHYKGKEARKTLATGKTDLTCITDMKLI